MSLAFSTLPAVAADAATTEAALLLQNNQVSTQMDPIYAQFRDQTRFWIQCVAVPLLMVIGSFGNIVTVIIMTRRRMRSTTNMYLAALAFVDMLYLVLTFLLGLSHYPNMAEYKYYAYWRLRPFLMMLTDACSNTSVWLTVTFTIERYIAVRFPMKGKVWCTEERAKKLIIIVFVFGILFALPVPLEWKVIEKEEGLVMIMPSQAREDQSEASILAEVLSQATAFDPGNQTSNSTNRTTPERYAFNGVIADAGLAVPLQLPGRSSIGSSDAGADDDLSINSTLPNLDHNVRDYNHSNQAVTTKRRLLTLDYTEFGRNNTYKSYYYSMTAVIFYFIPLFSLILFNGFLIKSVHDSKKERILMTRMQDKSDGTLNNEQANLNQPTSECKSNSKVEVNSPSHDDHQHETPTAMTQPDRIPTWLSANNESENLPSLKTVQREEVDSSSVLKPIPESSPSLLSLQLRELEVKHQHQLATQLEFQLEDERNEPTRVNGTTKIEAGRSSTGKNPAKLCLFEAKSAKFDTSSVGASTEGERAPMLVKERACDIPSSPNDSQRSPLSLKGSSCQKSSQMTNGFTAKPKLVPCATGTSQATIDNSMQSEHQQPISRVRPMKPPTLASTGRQTSLPAPTGGASSQERRITIMLIAVVILFLVCQVPTAAMLIYTSVHDISLSANEHALVLAFGNIFNFLIAVNAAGNFILYSFLSRKYRRTFIQLFCKCFSKPTVGNSTNSFGNYSRSSVGPPRPNASHRVQYKINSPGSYQNATSTTTTNTTAAVSEVDTLV